MGLNISVQTGHARPLPVFRRAQDSLWHWPNKKIFLCWRQWQWKLCTEHVTWSPRQYSHVDFIHSLIRQIALEHLLSRDCARHWRINKHTLYSQEFIYLFIYLFFSQEFIIKEMRQTVTKQCDTHKQGARPREQREGNTKCNWSGEGQGRLGWVLKDRSSREQLQAEQAKDGGDKKYQKL